MGRGKIEIKRIENANNRQVTYSKRRNGLIKKAKEISVLCNAQVSVIIFGGSKKVHEYCTPSAKLTDILDEYHRQCGKRLWDAKHENLNSEIDRIKKENDNLQIKLRHLNGLDINSLNHKELIVLEDVLENGLDFVRDHKMEFINTHRRNHKMLEEENKELNYYVQQLQDYNESHHQMPFPFRVQPLQLNLQERI